MLLYRTRGFATPGTTEAVNVRSLNPIYPSPDSISSTRGSSLRDQTHRQKRWTMILGPGGGTRDD